MQRLLGALVESLSSYRHQTFWSVGADLMMAEVFRAQGRHSLNVSSDKYNVIGIDLSRKVKDETEECNELRANPTVALLQ